MRKSRGVPQAVLAAAVVMCFGCGDPADQLEESPPPDQRDATAFAGERADDLVGDCEVEHLLLVVNDPGVSTERLDEKGVHTRASEEIVEFRAGADGRVGTQADQFFETVYQLDEVDYVGPVAMQQLVGSVEDYCAGKWREASPMFSPADYTEGFIDRIVGDIDGAGSSIDLAMYRISDNRVLSALEDAVERGVVVRLLFDEANGDHLDAVGSRSAQLEEMGVDVRYINRNMHHKFGIIDGPHNRLLEASAARFFNSSANLSFAAVTRFDENTVFHRRDPAVVLKMQRQFNHLWENSRNLAFNDELEYFETIPVEDEMIPPRGDLDIWWTSDNFETTYSDRWGPGFRPQPFSTVVADELVELIEGADSSVYVASRFLRLRPIAEALMNRWEEQPGLDVRVYLDQVEFFSESDFRDQEEELEECLDDADGDATEVYDCEERGLYFSYELVDRGIPVRFKTYSYHWHPAHAAQMHHKYLIVDDRTVATGSYNYSMNAEQNTMENVVVYRDLFYSELVDDFVANFEAIWETGRDSEKYAAVMDELESAEEELELVFEPMALEWDELRNLRDLVRQRCPDVDEEPDSYDSCEVE